jgi:hypothetical protein
VYWSAATTSLVCPYTLVTRMSTTPAPLTVGLVAVQLVPSATQVTLAPATVPNFTVVPYARGSFAPAMLLTRFVPVIVTTSPPATAPEPGCTPVTTGRVASPGIFHT